jgi:hypothetical protein
MTVESVPVECANCEAPHVVIPPTRGQFKDPVGEVPKVELPRVPGGSHLVEADVEARWTCRVCGRQNQTDALKLTWPLRPATRQA